MMMCPIHLYYRDWPPSLTYHFPPSFFIRPNMRKGKKHGRLFKLQVPMEKCLSTCPFTRACVRAYIRGCGYTRTAALLRLTSDRTTNASRKTRNRDRSLKIKLDHCRDPFSIIYIYSFPIYIFLFIFILNFFQHREFPFLYNKLVR